MRSLLFWFSQLVLPGCSLITICLYHPIRWGAYHLLCRFCVLTAGIGSLHLLGYKFTKSFLYINTFAQNYTSFNKSAWTQAIKIQKPAPRNKVLAIMTELSFYRYYPTTKENRNPSALAISINVLSCMSVCPCSSDEMYSRFLPIRSPNCCWIRHKKVTMTKWHRDIKHIKH